MAGTHKAEVGEGRIISTSKNLIIRKEETDATTLEEAYPVIIITLSEATSFKALYKYTFRVCSII